MTRVAYARLTMSYVTVLIAGAAGPAVAQLDTTIQRRLEARSIGPTGMSGRVGAIDAVETNPDVVYVGAATGGLWKSVNGGVTWAPLTDSLPAASIGAIAIYQPNPDLVWIGTGERNRRNSAGVGTGMYRSLDAGKTWARMGLENTGAIDAILLDPRNPDVVYVGALGNTWADTEDRGVYKSTDGGKTWRKVLYVNQRTGAGDLVMDPSNPQHLIAAMWEHRRWPWFFTSGGPGSGLYTTYDAGETWKKLGNAEGLPEGELGRIGLDFARGNPDVVYGLVEAKQSVVMRSADGGDTWTIVNQTRGINGRPFYYGQIRAHPTKENHVWIVESPVKVSEDGGKTFRTLLGFDQVHVDHHAYWVAPAGRVIWDGNDGGVYLSRDDGATWRFIENLPFSQFYHIAVDNEVPYHVYGGLQDNGSFTAAAAPWHSGGIRAYDWDEVAFGDGMSTFPDTKNARYGFTSTQNGDITRFDRVTGERKVIKPAAPDTGVTLRFNWNPGLSFDPLDGSVYLGSQFVHKSSDMGETWTTISPDLTTNDSTKQRRDSGGLTYDVSGAEYHTTILQIAASPVKRGVIWVGTDDGNVQVTRDGGRTWDNTSPRIRGVPAATWVPHIEPSRFDSATAFAVFDDHRRGNNQPYLFKTTDFGRTWTSLVTPDLQYFLHTVVQDPVNPNVLYLGSEFGLYVSLNGGRSWTLWRGVPRVPVQGLAVHPREHDLVVGTHGRGAFILDDVRPLRALAANPTITGQALHLFEVPPAVQYLEKQVAGPRFTGDAMFRGKNRPYGALLSYWVGGSSGTGGSSVTPAPAASAADTMVTIEVLAGDTVIRRFKGPAKRGFNRAAWSLTRNGFRTPRDEGDEPRPEGDDPPSGPDAIPGNYTVRITWQGQTASAPVVVAPDPRFSVSEADRRAKLTAMLRAGHRLEVATEAVNRLRDAKKAVDRVNAQLGSKDDTGTKALKVAGDSLKKNLGTVEELFVGRRGVQGFLGGGKDVMSRIGEALYAMSSSWDTPTPAQRAYLEQGEQTLQGALAPFNRIMAEEVAAYRSQVVAANLETVPGNQPLTVEWRRAP